MVRHTLKILLQFLQDFKSVSDHFGMLCIKGLKLAIKLPERRLYIPSENIKKLKFV